MNKRWLDGWLTLSARCTTEFSLRLAALLTCGALVSACGGGGGGGGGNATADSAAATPAPGLSFSSSAASVTTGQTVNLTWQASNADSCRASGGWSGDKPTSGTETSAPLQQAQNFSLSCSGAGGGVLREVSVNVTQDSDVRVDLRSDVTSVVANGQAQISWSSTNADSCTASSNDNWNGDVQLSGSFMTSPLTEDATYRISCFAQGQSASSTLTVDVVDTTIRWQAPTENVDGTQLTDLAGFNVYWGSSSRNYTGSVNLAASAREWEMGLSSGTYFLAITAIGGDASESDYSNEIVRTIP